MFQPQSQQAIERQEMLLRNPALLQQQQQQQTLTPAQYRAVNNYATALSDLAQIGGKYAIFANGLVEQINHLSTMAQVGEMALQIMNAAIAETHAAQDMIAVQNRMLSDPYFLVVHAFEVWYQNLNADAGGFMDLLSEAYVRLVEIYEELHRQTKGNYSEQYLQYLQSQISQQPAIPASSSAAPQQISAIKQFAQALGQAGAGAGTIGKQIQRQHALMHQQRAGGLL
jgi:hypothetical protein